jgi:tetratricopeptide (TPR) repeat protein
MSLDQEKWEWVDEDPIEKLVQGRRGLHEACSAIQPAAESAESSVTHGWAEFDPWSTAQAPESSSDTASTTASHFSEHLNRAFDLEKREQWQEAANSFREALKTKGGLPEALIGLGDCLLHLECSEEALAIFEQCLSNNAERERAMFGKAVALQKLARYEEADRAYRELLQITPDRPEPLANLVAVSVARRDTAALAEFSRQLLRLNPRSKAALQGLATHAIWNGDPAAADYCTRLLELDPSSPEGWFNLGFARQRLAGSTLRSASATSAASGT